MEWKQTTNMRNTILNQKIGAGVLSTVVIIAPFIAWAQVGIPCGDIVAGQQQCGFKDLIVLANSIIHFLMFSVAVPLAAIGIMFVGGKMVLSPNKESAKTSAKESFTNIAIGFLIMLGAYVVIKVIIYSFLNTGEGFFTYLVT